MSKIIIPNLKKYVIKIQIRKISCLHVKLQILHKFNSILQIQNDFHTFTSTFLSITLHIIFSIFPCFYLTSGFSKKNPRLISCNLIQYRCIQHVTFNDHSFPVFFFSVLVCTYKHKKDIKILLIKFFPLFLFLGSVVLQK